MKILLLGFLTIFIVQCYENNEEPIITRTSIIGKWKIIAFRDISLGKEITEPSNTPRSMYLEFYEDGTINGNSVSNDLTGLYKSENENDISISLCGSKIGETDWGDKLMKAYSLIHSYEIKVNKLYLNYNNNNNQIILIPVN